jgi:hypothetical protein
MWMSRRPTPPKQDFTDFYYKNVATGEGCGCAERVIDVHEFNRLAGLPKLRMPKFSFTRLRYKLGLYTRK